MGSNFHMNLLLRKATSARARLASIFREFCFICGGLMQGVKEARLVRRLLKKSPRNLPKASGVAVINSARSFPIHDVELYFGNLLSRCGMTVYVLFDDGVLEHWDSAQANRMKYFTPYRARWPISLRHRARWALVSHAYRRKGMRLIRYSKIKQELSQDDRDEAIARSSTKRFFQSGFINVEGVHQDYYEKSLRNCAIARNIAREVITQWNPDLFVTSHAIYSTWAPCYQEMVDAKVPVAVWQTIGTEPGRIRISDRRNGMLSVTEDWLGFDKSVAISDKIRKEGTRLLEDRIGHKAQDTREYFGNRVRQGEIGDNIKKEADRFCFGMFPNVVWDGDIPERNLFFENVVEWCEFTIRTIRGTNHQLIVRFHPAEVTRLAGSVQLENLIRAKIPDLDSIPNVRVIPSSEPVDSYELAKQLIDVGLIYDGHLCLELTSMGIPVVACTNGNFTPDSVVLKPIDIQQFAQWLQNPLEITSIFSAEERDRVDQACKFAYWEFGESLLSFNPIEKPYPPKINYDLEDMKHAISHNESAIAKRLLDTVALS